VVSTAPLVDASGNWWGTDVEADVLAYTDGLVDFTPFLTSGTDIDGGAVGFQGDFTSCSSPLGEQSGAVGRIQEGIDLVTNSTVFVGAGTFAENVHIYKSVTLTGSRRRAGQSADDPCPGCRHRHPDRRFRGHVRRGRYGPDRELHLPGRQRHRQSDDLRSLGWTTAPSSTP
jgi:hypothetical protein